MTCGIDVAEQGGRLTLKKSRMRRRDLTARFLLETNEEGTTIDIQGSGREVIFLLASVMEKQEMVRDLVMESMAVMVIHLAEDHGLDIRDEINDKLREYKKTRKDNKPSQGSKATTKTSARKERSEPMPGVRNRPKKAD